MSRASIKPLDFQLAYLIELTREGLKPLSRWERPLNAAGCEIIRSEGLVLETVLRRTRIGRKLRETVFSRRPRYTALYRKHFDGTRLRDAPDAARLQGRLFGYPSCCVEAFIRNPYVSNDLAPADQKILFHWACPSCTSTPGLLREYRRVHSECLKRWKDLAVSPGHSSTGRGFARALASATASLAFIAGTTTLPAYAQDPHWLYAADDADQDYLSYAEEIIRGTNWENPDTDQNQVLDGVQLSLLLSQLITSPPIGVELEDHMALGLEECMVCGMEINMGYITISNTSRELSVDLPYMALHYLENGCLAYLGTLHWGRIDLDALKKILVIYNDSYPIGDPVHLLPTGGDDSDNDGLNFEEEPPLGTDPNDSDTDNDSVKDGSQVAENLIPLIAQLPREVIPDGPYIQEFQMDGVEQCEICGAAFNMGYVEITNPLEGLSVTIPYVGLHTIAHGGFVFDGTVNEGRTLPLALRTVLIGDGMMHWVPIASDTDEDGLTDVEEPFFDLDPMIQDENSNGIPDGRELAMTMASKIHALTADPSCPDSLYKIDHPLRGFNTCQTCGEEINMGYVEVVNPLEAMTADVPYYSLHFMDHGSFSTDRDDIYPRIDPCYLGEVLGITGIASAIEDPEIPQMFSLRSSPNPFELGGTTEIALVLPALEQIDVAIYDVAGRRVRGLFKGKAPDRVMNLRWDGRNDRGEAAGSGVYFCKVSIGSMTVAGKITLIH